MALTSGRSSPYRPSMEGPTRRGSFDSRVGNGEDDASKMDDEGETVSSKSSLEKGAQCSRISLTKKVESVMNKLAIERRVQYGAEKMLDVIEQRGSSESAEQDQVKDRITSQLEAANEQIKMLESRLERLQSSSGTPSRHRRRPQPRLNGYGSTSSLGQSVGSSSFLSGSSRPRPSRAGSSYLTPDRDGDDLQYAAASGPGTPSRRTTRESMSRYPSSEAVYRPRSSSTGGDQDQLGGYSRFQRSRAGSGFATPAGEALPEDENIAVLLDSLGSALRRLRDMSRSKGKGKEVDRGDEVTETLIQVGDMLKKSEGLKLVIAAEEVIASVLPYMGDSSDFRRRAAGYRALRYILDRSGWKKMLQAGLEWLIIRTFTRDAKAVQEREQALRLIRAVITLPPRRLRRNTSFTQSRASPARSRPSHSRNASQLNFEPINRLMEERSPVTDGIVRAIVSAAENPDDAMRTACMETLIELGVLDFPRLAQSDAFRTLLLTFKDGPLELGAAITGLLLFLSNGPANRHFLLPGSDLETVLAPMTEETGNVPPRQHGRFVEKLQHSVRNVSMLLSSWPGLLYLCMDDCRAIRSLISALHIAVPEMQEALLDLFFSAVRIKLPSYMDAFLEGKRLTIYNRMQQAASQQLLDEPDGDIPPPSLNLVDHFVSLLLAIFIEAGLIEAILTVIEDNSSSANLSRKATLLLGEILRIGNQVLPLQFAAKLQALPRLFSGATEFSNANERNFALSALSSIDSLNRNQAKGAAQPATRERAASTASQDPLRQAQNAKMRLGMQIEDRQFQQTIVDTNVLLVRDHTKWNFELITTLMEGPMLNTKRMDDTIRATKFFRRLFSFYHPYNNRFSAIKRTRPNHKWVKLACSLISLLLASQEGIKFLSEDKMLRQLADCFTELEQHPTRFNAVFSVDRLENTLSYGYFEMIGVLTKHREGLKLLEKNKYFNSFYHLSEKQYRDDIVRLTLECFDYTLIFFSKALTSSRPDTRLFATHQLGQILAENTALQDWSLQLMITQLYDVSMEVCDVAVMYLEDACCDPPCLGKVVLMRPSLEHLGDIGHPLFMRFVSTSAGFDYLYQSEYINREFDNWVAERNVLYVIEAETFVSKTLRPFMHDNVEDQWQYEGMAPTHFFGELTKTPEGRMYLKERGVVPEYAELLRLHGMEASDSTILTSVKMVLWALGNIGSTEGGLPFLEDEEIIEVIVEIAEQSPVLTIKGTCFFVIGLLSSTRQGAELLEELGWIATRTPMGKMTGLCLPNDISRFVAIEPWTRAELRIDAPPLAKLSGLDGDVLTWMANLSNYVLAAGAMNNLKRARNRHPRHFSSMNLFHRALRLISSNHFQAPVRRFILDLFNISLEPETLLQLRRIEETSHSRNNFNNFQRQPSDHNEPGKGQGQASLGLQMSPDTNAPNYQPRDSSRRRSASYPGQIPAHSESPPMPTEKIQLPGKKRSRGITISDVRQGGSPSSIGPPQSPARITGFDEMG